MNGVDDDIGTHALIQVCNIFNTLLFSVNNGALGDFGVANCMRTLISTDQEQIYS
jgi:hypothetical protein